MSEGVDVEQCLAICENLRTWFRRNDYQGLDPYLVDEIVFRYQSFPLMGSIRALLKPFHPFIPKTIFSMSRPTYVPKALGLIIAGNSSLFRCTDKHEMEYVEESERLIDTLMNIRSEGFDHICWGVPFEWGNRPRYPKNYPMAIVTSQIGLALLDFHQIKPTERTLDICADIARFLTEDNGFWAHKGQLCFYYSSLDKHRAPNVNAYCLAFLARYDEISGEDHSDYTEKGLNFMFQTQTEDGSWPYLLGASRIDSRHTGFILSSLSWVAQIIQSDSRIRTAIDRGWRFYRQNLFDGIVPKWSPNRTYPVDIHDVAQGIITASTLGHLDFAQELVRFALEKFFDGRDEFYYKLFKNGRVNKVVFIRWNQGWMFRALALFVENLM